MKKLALLLMGIAAWTICESHCQAQVGYVTYYQPAAVVSPPPVYYSSYYTPAPTVVPTVVTAPAPVYTAPAPVYAAPAPVYAAPVYYQQPVVRTRYRPLLGGTVTRVRPGFRRAYYAPAVYAY